MACPGLHRCSLNGNRTRISALRGLRPRPLDDKADGVCLAIGSDLHSTDSESRSYCCPARIRTSISRSRVCCLAIRRRGKHRNQAQSTQFRPKCQRLQANPDRVFVNSCQHYCQRLWVDKKTEGEETLLYLKAARRLIPTLAMTSPFKDPLMFARSLVLHPPTLFD